MKGTISEQIMLQQVMQANGLNLVTCADCGSTFIHRTSLDEIICPICKLKQSTSDATDYFYEGMPEQIEELNNKQHG